MRDDAAEKINGSPTEAEVARYLRHHPDFLSRHPELLSALTPP